MSAATTYVKNSAEQVVAAAKAYANRSDGYMDYLSTDLINKAIQSYVDILTGFQNNSILRKHLNFTPYINQVKALFVPEMANLAKAYGSTFSDGSALLELGSAATLAAGDTLGFYSFGITKFELLDGNKKVLMSGKVGEGESVAVTLPAKFDASKGVYLKVYGKSGKEYDFVTYEVSDPSNVNVGAGSSAAGSIQFTGDKDVMSLLDAAGFKALAQSGAGEWRVQVSSSAIDSLSAAFGKVAGVKAEKFALEDGNLVADIARSGPGAIAKALALEVTTKKNVTIGSQDMDYTVSFLSDDYSADKQTAAHLDLRQADSASLQGKFTWKGDIDWVKLSIGSIDASGSETYVLSGLSQTADFTLYDAGGKKLAEVDANELTFTKAGTYYLQIEDAAAAAGTAYTLEATLVGVPDGAA